MPGQFQQDALLGIHELGFPWGNPKESGVEEIQSLEESALVDTRLPTVRIDIRRPLPSPGRQRPNGGLAVLQKSPEFFESFYAAGQASRKTDNGNVLLARLGRCWRYR